MEINQHIHSHILPIPMEYDQSNLFFPPNYNFNDDQPPFNGSIHGGMPDNGYMDTFFYPIEEPVLYDTFMDIEEALPIKSPQREKSASPGGDHNFNKLSLTDLLLVAAEAFDSDNWHLALGAIAQLDQILFNQETETSPFLRLAYFFAQGLRSRALGPQSEPTMQIPAALADDMSPYQMVQELSPHVKFAHFTANQAILEATEGDHEVHIVDYDVMEGLQWPPLMVDLARRNGTSLRITAIVTGGNAGEVCRTGRRLVEFAQSIGLMLIFNQLSEGDFDKIVLDKGQIIANCMVHQLQMPSKSFTSVTNFLGNVRKLSPKMVVLVQEELFKATSKSFVEFFCEALHHFSSVSDSLVSSFNGGYKGGLRQVEKEILGPRIVDYLSHFPCGSLSLEGFKMIPLSSCNVSQAKFLVGIFSRGYGVEHEKGRLALCWKSRPLITASIWVPN